MPAIKLLKMIYDDFLFRIQKILNTYRLLEKYKKKHIELGRNCFLKRCEFGEYSRVYDDCHLVDVFLDDRSYISENCSMFDVRIGRYCAIGPHVTIGLGIHPAREFVSIHPLFYSKTNSACMEPMADKNYLVEHKSITIGHDVWIGANAIIHDGVTIDNGAIVASGAVVTKDIPPYAVVAGIPAKILRFRFEENQIEFLQKFCWWHKGHEWLTQNWKDFHDIKKFMKTYSDSKKI